LWKLLAQFFLCNRLFNWLYRIKHEIKLLKVFFFLSIDVLLFIFLFIFVLWFIPLYALHRLFFENLSAHSIPQEGTLKNSQLLASLFLFEICRFPEIELLLYLFDNIGLFVVDCKFTCLLELSYFHHKFRSKEQELPTKQVKFQCK
jgi:hypothetical protein